MFDQFQGDVRRKWAIIAFCHTRRCQRMLWNEIIVHPPLVTGRSLPSEEEQCDRVETGVELPTDNDDEDRENERGDKERPLCISHVFFCGRRVFY